MGAKRGRKPLAETTLPLNADPTFFVEPVCKKATKSLSRSRVDALLEELDMEVAARQSAILAMTQAAMEALQSEFQMALMAFPRAVQQMTLASFLSRFNGDVALYRSRNFAGNKGLHDGAAAAAGGSSNKGMQEGAAASSMAGGGGGSVAPQATCGGDVGAGDQAASLTATGRSSRSRSRVRHGSEEAQLGAETPHPLAMHTPVAGIHTRSSSSYAQTPATVIRAPRPGEVVLSANGSPLGTIHDGMVTPMGPAAWGPHARIATATPGTISITATVRRAQPRRGGGGANQSAGQARPAEAGSSPEVKSPNIMLTTDAGEVIDIGALRAGGAELPPELGAEVQEKLGRLHEKVSRIMAQLNA
eukprot:jgi/Mesvir1/15829/Mv03382-RA.1